MLHICILMPMRVIIAQLPILKDMYKSKSSSVFLVCPLLLIIWLELQAHPTLWWDFEVNNLLQYILFKKLYGAFDEMVDVYERSMWYFVGGIRITSSMSLLVCPMWNFCIHRSYSWFTVHIKLTRLIVATNIKLPHIIYEAQLVLIIEIIALNDLMLNIAVQYLLRTCGISICWLCYIRNNYLENTRSKLFVKHRFAVGQGLHSQKFIALIRRLDPAEQQKIWPQYHFGSRNLHPKKPWTQPPSLNESQALHIYKRQHIKRPVQPCCKSCVRISCEWEL